MHPVKLTIEGDWWDSYVYAGSLYLVQVDGTVVTVPWRRLVEQLGSGRDLDDLALELAFVDARYLYGDQWARLVADREIQDVLRGKFARLSQVELAVTAADLNRVGSRAIPGLAPEALADIEIHRGLVYFAGTTGLLTARRGALTHGATSRKVWDAELFRVRARAGVLALAAGEEGLFQRRAGAIVGASLLDQEDEPDQLVRGDFFSCGWVGSSIYASSYANAGTLALFSQHSDRRERRTYRVFETAIADRQLFEPAELRAIQLSTSPRRDEAIEEVGSPTSADDQDMVFESRIAEPAEAAPSAGGLSWGGYDLVCQTHEDTVQVARYQARRKRLQDKFRIAPGFELPADSKSSEVIAGDVAPFGVVVESDRDLFVLNDEGVWQLGFEPVRWRTFSRATNYPNQLHVVGEDRVEILSFHTALLSVLREQKRLMGRTRR